MNCPKCGNIIEENHYRCEHCNDYFVYIRKPELKRRFISAGIDGLIVFLIWRFIPMLTILAGFYILFRDIITPKGSVGKMLTGLIIVDVTKKIKAGFRQKIARNAFLSSGLFILVLLSILENIYLVGIVFRIAWIAVFGSWILFAACEIYYIYTDENGQRLSDRLAKTTVM